MSRTYRALVIDVDGGSVRLEPTADTEPPTMPTEVNLLSLSLAMALGGAGYQHHSEPRPDGTQNLDSLLAGHTTMPWRHGHPEGETHEPLLLICEQGETGAWKCRVEPASPSTDGQF